MSVSPELARLFYELWEESLAGREYVLNAELPEAIEKLPRSEAGGVTRTLRYLNRVGHLLAKGPLPADFAISLIGKEVIEVQAKLGPLLDAERARRGDPTYLEHIDHLLQVCRQAYPDYNPPAAPGGQRRPFGLGN
jgi:hypothetical protein